jgi:hypothetical protein
LPSVPFLSFSSSLSSLIIKFLLRLRSAFGVCPVLAPESPLIPSHSVQVLHDDDLGLRSLSSFSSIGAMDEPKAALREAVELPMRYPELFRGSALLQPVKVREASCLRRLLNRKR